MMLEHAWWAAHAAPWFPGWMWFQAVAIVVGALLLVVRGGPRLFVAYAVGVVLAGACAIALGSGAAWLAWAEHGARGPLPELEIAGFGAIAGLVLGYVLVARARAIDTARALDVLAAPIGAMIAIARTGCFFAGCDFGTPATLPWALAYPPMTPAFRAQLDAGLLDASAARTLPVHPTQLYEAAIGLVVLVAALVTGRPQRAGDRFAAAALTYAAGRIAVDVFRGDLARGGALGLTTTQALALVLTGAVVAWRFSVMAGRHDETGHESDAPDGHEHAKDGIFQGEPGPFLANPVPDPEAKKVL
jgi:phosphatidylglycerol:prolipoprotein diacylglycerol transferase